MADFRKWVLVLAVVAAFVIPANAQVACTVQASNTTVRSEGLAEPVSTIKLACAPVAGAVAGPVVANLTAFFTANVTNRRATATSTTTDAILTIFAGGATLPGPIQGILSSNQSLTFNAVTIDALTAAAPFQILINNVRLNANSAGAGSTLSVIMSATSPTNVLVFNGTPVATVANVQTGLVFAAASSTVASIPQCTTGAVSKVTVNFTEGFAGSFKTLTSENGTVMAVPGITPPGTATQGTRLFVRYAAIPTGVTLAVPQNLVSGSGATIATLVGFDPTVSTTSTLTAVGSTSPFVFTFSGTQTSGTPTNAAFLVPLTGGTGTAVYEITDDSTLINTAGTVALPTAITTASGVPVTTSTTTPTVSGGFAPISTVTTASSTAPIPRFVDVANQNLAMFSITPCVTNILFPFLTNQAGFDTGVALINTSADNSGGGVPFNTTPQSGTCTVSFFGSVTGGGAVPAPQTTPTIAAGQMFTFALSAGGVAGSTSSTVGFQGYAIARCNFQFAHGYAFVSDLGATKLAHGYLAPIIPDRGGSRLAQPFSAGTPAGTGEQLVF